MIHAGSVQRPEIWRKQFFKRQWLSNNNLVSSEIMYKLCGVYLFLVKMCFTSTYIHLNSLETKVDTTIVPIVLVTLISRYFIYWNNSGPDLIREVWKNKETMSTSFNANFPYNNEWGIVKQFAESGLLAEMDVILFNVYLPCHLLKRPKFICYWQFISLEHSFKIVGITILWHHCFK